MNRKAFVEGECLFGVILITLFLAETIAMIGGTKQYLIAQNKPPQLAVLTPFVVWPSLLFVCWMFALLSHLIKWPKRLYPNTPLNKGDWLRDNKGNYWEITNITNDFKFDLETKIYPARPGYVLHTGQCNLDLSNFSTSWKDKIENHSPGTKLHRSDNVPVRSLTAFLFAISMLTLPLGFFKY